MKFKNIFLLEFILFKSMEVLCMCILCVLFCLVFFIALSRDFVKVQIQEKIQVRSSKMHDKIENSCSLKLSFLPKFCLMTNASSFKIINLSYIKIFYNTSL